VRNLYLATFELWQIRFERGQISDTLVGWINVEDLEGLDRGGAHAVAMKAFGVPLPEDFVPAE
jgi:hypothetical protein